MPRSGSWLTLSVLAVATLAGAPPELGIGHTLVPRQTWTDELGHTHTRYVHSYLGRRVWGSELVDHQGAETARSTWGLAIPASGSDPLRDHPINRPEASKAMPFLARRGAVGEAILYPVYVDIPAQGATGDPSATEMDHHLVEYVPATLITNPPEPQEPGAEGFTIIVEDETGEVLEAFPENESQTPVKGTGRSFYSGTVSLDTTMLDGGSYVLWDQTRGRAGNSVWDQARTNGPGVLYASSTNSWGNGMPELASTRADDPTLGTMAVDIAYGLQKSWDYFATIHKRSGIDGLGHEVRAYAHAGPAVDGAFWRASWNSIHLNSPWQYRPLTTVANLAHEFSHGVNRHSAGLLSVGESGGLNEANSDIFGAMVGEWNRTGSGASIGDRGTDWTLTFQRFLGLGLTQPVVKRNFIKPSKPALDQPPSPDAWGPDLGGLEVHRACGPMNRAFYFLSAGSSANPASEAHSSLLPEGMKGIGNDKAAAIWYRTLTTYLTPTSRYVDARLGAIQAAADLYGYPSAPVSAVGKAFAAINVGPPTAAPARPGASLAVTVTASGSNLTFAATPEGVSGITEVHFYVDSWMVGSAFAPPFSLTLDGSQTFNNRAHYVFARVFSANGAEVSSPAVSFTLDNETQQVLGDPGFEAGSRRWLGDRKTLVKMDPLRHSPHGGARWVQFNGLDSGGRTLSLKQDMRIPDGSNYAVLKLWLNIKGRTDSSADRLTLSVESPATLDGTPPTLLGTLATLAPVEPGHGWVEVEYDVSAFTGRPCAFKLEGCVAPDSERVYNVDDVRLLCSPTVPLSLTGYPGHLDFSEGEFERATLTARVVGDPDQRVTWTILEPSGGTLTPMYGTEGPDPIYTQPLVAGTYQLQVQSVADQAGSHATATVPVVVHPRVQFQPSPAIMTTSETRTFTLATGPGVEVTTPRADKGIVVPTGPNTFTYKAPSTKGIDSVQVYEKSEIHQTRYSVAIIVNAPVAVTVAPATAVLAAGAGLQLSDTVVGDPSESVAWSIAEGQAGGFVSPTGLFVAPTLPGTYHVLATSVLDPTQAGMATVVVRDVLAIDPPSATLLAGASLTFAASVPGQANQAVRWTLPPGAGSFAGGTYTAPAKAGTYVLTATSDADPSLSAQATVTVKTTDLNGNGIVPMDFEDLAILADAYGQLPAVGAADLNGDGVTDELDVTLFLSQFVGLP